MITTENIKGVLTELLKPEEIQRELDKDGDFISLELYITNTGGTARVLSVDYNEEQEQEHNDNGNLYCDKDVFESLLIDAGIRGTNF